MQVRKGAAANGDGVEKGSGDRVRAMHLRAPFECIAYTSGADVICALSTLWSFRRASQRPLKPNNCCVVISEATQREIVLHAFEKTTNGVDHKEMATAAKRYKEMKKRVDAERLRAKTLIPKARK
jgi:hypothetical protein